MWHKNKSQRTKQNKTSTENTAYILKATWESLTLKNTVITAILRENKRRKCAAFYFNILKAIHSCNRSRSNMHCIQNFHAYTCLIHAHYMKKKCGVGIERGLPDRSARAFVREIKYVAHDSGACRRVKHWWGFLAKLQTSCGLSDDIPFL